MMQQWGGADDAVSKEGNLIFSWVAVNYNELDHFHYN